jgi:GntR family transcriptional regulator
MLNAARLAVDGADPTPLYLQLADRLRTLIDDGSVDVGSALPSERDISLLAGISRVTVRKAIEALLREGLLSRRPGSGTYVARRIEQPASLLAGFSASMASRGARPGSTWLEKRLAEPSPEDAAILALSAGSQVVKLARVRTADDEPLAIERAVVPAALLPPVPEIGESLYAALERRGHRPVRGTQRLHASLASPQEAELLGVPDAAPVLRIERRTFLPSGLPVEITRSAYRGDRFDFVTEIGERILRAGTDATQ